MDNNKRNGNDVSIIMYATYAILCRTEHAGIITRKRKLCQCEWNQLFPFNYIRHGLNESPWQVFSLSGSLKITVMHFRLSLEVKYIWPIGGMAAYHFKHASHSIDWACRPRPGRCQSMGSVRVWKTRCVLCVFTLCSGRVCGARGWQNQQIILRG